MPFLPLPTLDFLMCLMVKLFLLFYLLKQLLWIFLFYSCSYLFQVCYASTITLSFCSCFPSQSCMIILWVTCFVFGNNSLKKTNYVNRAAYICVSCGNTGYPLARYALTRLLRKCFGRTPVFLLMLFNWIKFKTISSALCDLCQNLKVSVLLVSCTVSSVTVIIILIFSLGIGSSFRVHAHQISYVFWNFLCPCVAALTSSSDRLHIYALVQLGIHACARLRICDHLDGAILDLPLRWGLGKLAMVLFALHFFVF